MRKYRLIYLLLLSSLVVAAQTPTWVNGQAARALIGQSSFANLQVPSQSVLGNPGGVAFANGTLWVADASTMCGLVPNNPLGLEPGLSGAAGCYIQDNRVLAFPTSVIPAPNADLTALGDPYCNLCGYSASIVLGQQNFSSFEPGTSQIASSSAGSMQNPSSVATDGSRLGVADSGNNRVLLWNSVPGSTNAAPDIVLGQSSFSGNLANVGLASPTASSLRGPEGVWINADGHVFVADSQNHRILIWNHFPTSSNQPADVVLGQANFVTGTQASCNTVNPGVNPAASASELCDPASVTSDGTRVYVADYGFNRVLIWNSIPTSNGQPADVVVGQPDMTSTIPNNTNGTFCPDGYGPIQTLSSVNAEGITVSYTTGGQCNTNMNFPRFALADAASNQLFVADGGDGRVMIFSPIPTTNGAAAVAVLGQPNFETDVNSSASASVASTQIDNTSAVDLFPVPTALAYDPIGQNLYVADPTNNRILIFTPGQTQLVANSVVNWASEIIRQEGVVTFTPYTAGASPVANDTVTVTIAGTNYGPYTIKSTDTFDTIAQAMVGLINAGAGDPNVIATFSGTGTGSLYLSSKGINLSFDAISLAATTSNSLNEVAITSGAYLSSGTGATGAPGMLVEINGTNLSDATPSNPAVAAMSGIIPTTLGGAQVYFNGVAAPVFRAASNQVISQLPFTVGLNGANSASVYVRTVHNDGSVTVTNTTPFYIAPANPGIFDAPIVQNQPRPWPAVNVYHQPGNPTAVVSVDGTINAGDVATITIAGKAYNYTVLSTDTTYSVAQALASQINSAPDPNVTASLGGQFSRVILTAIQSGAAGVGISVAGSASSSADIVMTAYTGSTCCNVTPGSPISASNPAGPGELISISAAGMGFIANPVDLSAIVPATGQPYNGTVPNVVQSDATVSATMGGSTAEVINAGLPTGSYGVYQVQLIVPSSLSTNALTQLDIAQNAFVSNTVTIAVGTPGQVIPVPPPASTSPITISIDEPGSNAANLSGTIPVAGWAVDVKNAISSVTFSVDGTLIGSANYGSSSRADVCAIYTSAVGCPNVGFNSVLDTTQFSDGSHTLSVTVTDSTGTQLTASNTFTTSNYSGTNPTVVSIDTPGTQSGPFQGSALFSGWAINTTSPINSNGVTVSIDGQPQPGAATYGLNRPDVCGVYPNAPGCPNVGWSYLVDTTALSNGNHTITVKATAGNGQYTVQAHTFNVANWTTANPITISIGSPSATSGSLSGTVTFGGWIVDLDAPIFAVGVSIDGVQYNNAAYGIRRTDVCAIYNNAPGCPNVGWNVGIDTTLLGDGQHTLGVTAIPASGNGLTVTRQFTVSNGATANTTISIDVPGSSSNVLSGITNIGGWAVNSNAPVSTVEIIIDGVSKGYATYGGPRSDVCAIVGNLPGCPDIGWNFLLDTTMLTNGGHMLEVTVTSANGQRASRSAAFSVSNNEPSGPTTVTITRPNSTSNPFQGIANFAGTAASTSSQVTTVSITVDGVPYGTASPIQGSFANGWTFLLNTNQLPDGGHSLGATALAADGTFAVASASFQVANWSSPDPLIISIDVPNSPTEVLSGVYHIGGWAIDQNAVISSVTISVDGIPFGYAAYGGTRNDVCSAYKNIPGCPNVGWDAGLDTGTLTNGTHTLAVTATTVNGQSSTTTATFLSVN